VRKIYVALGRNADAFAWLEKARVQRSHSMVFLKVDPAFRPLRRDQRSRDSSRRSYQNERPTSEGHTGGPADADAELEALFPRVYDELRAMAHGIFMANARDIRSVRPALFMKRISSWLRWTACSGSISARAWACGACHAGASSSTTR
jgi:hypothetical protein